ncbi:MAG: iron uptake porin [cyanobacterium endosymbiont of Rhopalodia musculus]|uniref:iron uptake porin n=1 Tax=cyanobacterium endosymbiont of Epithemia clementina EcSB TaxID=3034674 RepID=UPI00315D9A01
MTNVADLRDVSPENWAYDALNSLRTKYNCFTGYPDLTLKGNKNLSRDELVSAMDSCLQAIEKLSNVNSAVTRQDIEKLKRMIQEYESEIAALGARTYNSESRVAFVENHQFSVTSHFSGEMITGLTGVFQGEKNEGTEDIFKVTNIGHRGRLKFNTTFDGNDSLYIRFTTGTAPDYSDIADTFEGKSSFTHPDESDLAVQLIIYSFALAENVRMFVEPVGGAFDDFVPTLNFLDGDAAFGSISAFGTRNPVYYMPGGPGIGFRGRIFNVFEWSGGYLAKDGESPRLGAGMFNGPYGVMGQLAYEPHDDFKIAFTYLHGHNNLDSGTGTQRSNMYKFLEKTFEHFDGSLDTINNSYRVEFSWHLNEKIVVGAWGGFTTTRTLGAINLGKDLEPIGRGQQRTWNWAGNVSFPDLFVEGDTAGFIIGMEPWVAESNLKFPNGLRNNDRNSSFHVEAIYQFPLNNYITVTPGVVYISAPDFSHSNKGLVIGTIRTTFTF